MGQTDHGPKHGLRHENDRHGIDDAPENKSPTHASQPKENKLLNVEETPGFEKGQANIVLQCLVLYSIILYHRVLDYAILQPTMS